MTTAEKATAYTLLKIGIESYLKAYTEYLEDCKKDMAKYEALEMDSLVELKKEHCDTMKGKIEILKELQTK